MASCGAPFLVFDDTKPKLSPEVIKQLPDRLRGLAGKRVVIDGTLITQRLHFAPAPHPYRHVLGWYRLARELKEAGVSVVCVFDGKERNMAKAREAERRREVQRKTKARGVLEMDRSNRLKQLSDVLPRFWDLDDTSRKRTAGLLRQSSPGSEVYQPQTTATIPSTQQKPATHTPSVDASAPEEQPTSRLSVADIFVPEFVADEVIENKGHLIADYAESLLLEAELTSVEDHVDSIPPDHPWFQEPVMPSYMAEPIHLPLDSEPDLYTSVTPTLDHAEDITPPTIIENEPPTILPPDDNISPASDLILTSTSEDFTLTPPSERPTLGVEDQTSSAESSTPPPPSEPASSIPPTPTTDQTIPPSSAVHSLPTPEEISSQLSALYLDYRQSVSRFAILSDPLPSSLPATPAVGDPDTQAEIVMTKAQYQLTLEEGQFWDTFSEAHEPKHSRLPDALEKLSSTSDLMSASFERRMNPPTMKTYNESKEILRAMGVPCVEPSGAFEAEALASSMVLNGLADYVVSEDTDVLVYEAPLIRNLTSKNTPLTVVSGADIRTVLQLSRASFVDFALLLGTDFSQRIKNVGPARALKMIREHKSIERVIELETKYAPPISPQAYLDQVELARVVFCTLPPVPEAGLLEQGEVDEEALVELLQKYGLGREVMNLADSGWDYGAALAGNYFQDNPNAV